ncbi:MULTISPECIES: DUF202 domain-containing protein [unclassified Mesorhizobium]|uniref:DUF202 domain-containing protein n=1 Tax=unclassified Mesorhizobium TaxID=325217 RepID=UPI000FD2BE11|nr:MULTISPECIES: DUF202 domain-containing protein [unclassified Mesorhizobium]RUV93548.1 DUF202 domain-containing protein [Mesorhizobium sp. M1A.F.Ca.IN.020.04.1.1]TIR67668.1 MAG: DUF202 domain-containing protein [Mesorhizobium sp.]
MGSDEALAEGFVGCLYDSQHYKEQSPRWQNKMGHMNRSSIAIAFFGFGVVNWCWPGFDGWFFPAASVSVGDGRIVGAIFIVGAGVVWVLQRQD